MEFLGWREMILLMSEAHCDNRVGPRILGRQKVARKRLQSTRRGPTSFKGREGEWAAERDREEPRGQREWGKDVADEREGPEY